MTKKLDRKRLHLKLRAGFRGPDLDKVLAAARKAGAVGVHPLFPETKDGELSSFFTVDVPRIDATRVMKELNALRPVEFVEEEVKRSLKAM